MKILLAGIAFLFSIHTQAQITKDNLRALQTLEDSLKVPAYEMIQGYTPEARFYADSVFTKMLVRALRTPHSFQYPFDSIKTVSMLYAPDSTFRIFTWHLVINENAVRQKGAIQMRMKDGSLKLFPLIDMSDEIENIADTITSHNAWVGAIYYNIIQNKRGTESVYTLLGFDENNFRSTRKYIEVLKFVNGEPVFGEHTFTVPDNQLQSTISARFVMEYKKDAAPRLIYDADFDMIVKEHLISETNEPNKKYTLIGDGDYEGFKWMEGRWNYISKIFTEVTPEDQFPMPAKILNDDGSYNMVPEDDKPKRKSKKKNR